MTTYISYDVDTDVTGLVEIDYGEWAHSMNHSGYKDITDDGIHNLYDHLKPGDEVYVCIEGTYNLYTKSRY